MASRTVYVATYLLVDVFCIIMSHVVIRNVREGFGSELETRFFRRLIRYYQVFCLSDALWLPVNAGVFGPHPGVNAWLSSLNMFASCFVAYFWFCYCEVRMRTWRLESPAQLAFSQLPLMAVVALYVANPFTSWVFSIDARGAFVQGPLYIVPAAAAGGYVALTAVKALAAASRAEGREGRREFLTLASFAVMPGFGCVFDVLVPNTPVIALTALGSVVLVFANLQDARIFNDALTGLNNRRRADQYLASRIASADGQGGIYLYVLDVNLFKRINDTYGHLEGDRALQVVAEGLRRAVGRCAGFAARWGGDEFVLVADSNRVADPEDVVRLVDETLAAARHDAHLPYDLSVTCGYAACDSAQASPGRLISEADKMLYDRKQAFHRSVA